LDHRNDTIGIGQNVVVPKPQHQPTAPLQEPIPRIVFAWLGVLPAIGLDNDCQCGTGKIEHERRHRVLAPEMPAHTVPPQSRPQPTFRFRGRPTCAAGQFGIDGMCHGRHPLPTSPAARERGYSAAALIANALT
jgi:hypothetical protein